MKKDGGPGLDTRTPGVGWTRERHDASPALLRPVLIDRSFGWTTIWQSICTSFSVESVVPGSSSASTTFEVSRTAVFRAGSKDDFGRAGRRMRGTNEAQRGDWTIVTVNEPTLLAAAHRRYQRHP